MPQGEKFATTDHCGTIQILDHSIVPEYLLYALTLRREEESFDRSFRASLNNTKDFKIGIAIRPDGSFDVEAQREIAAKWMESERSKVDVEKVKTQVDSLTEKYLKAKPRITGS